jgi:hypothetical protein
VRAGFDAEAASAAARNLSFTPYHPPRALLQAISLTWTVASRASCQDDSSPRPQPPNVSRHGRP